MSFYYRLTGDKEDLECDKSVNQEKNLSNDVDDLIRTRKLTDVENEQIDIEKGENFDSEEETG